MGFIQGSETELGGNFNTSKKMNCTIMLKQFAVIKSCSELDSQIAKG